MAKEKTHFVYSTLANDQSYTNYTDAKDRRSDLPSVIGSVYIKGGFGVADKQFLTPQGAVTEVDDDELEMLNANYDFQQHVKRGHIKVSDMEAPAEKVAADMDHSDPSLPLNENDYADGKAPKTGAPVDEK
jgi:hypothetical protein